MTRSKRTVFRMLGSSRSTAFTLAVALAAIACQRPASQLPVAQGVMQPAASPQDQFWNNLRSLCESAAQGKLLQAPAGDTQIDPAATLVVHFWQCGESELRFPLHVDNNRSRTWVFMRHADRLELRHDHRHADGTEESNTWYGATTLDAGSANRQDFVTERNGVRGGWRVEIEPSLRFVYGTARNGEWRHQLEFDLTTPVARPPLPWGHETRPSQRPEPPFSARHPNP